MDYKTTCNAVISSSSLQTGINLAPEELWLHYIRPTQSASNFSRNIINHWTNESSVRIACNLHGSEGTVQVIYALTLLVQNVYFIQDYYSAFYIVVTATQTVQSSMVHISDIMRGRGYIIKRRIRVRNDWTSHTCWQWTCWCDCPSATMMTYKHICVVLIRKDFT